MHQNRTPLAAIRPCGVFDTIGAGCRLPCVRYGDLDLLDAQRLNHHLLRDELAMRKEALHSGGVVVGRALGKHRAPMPSKEINRFMCAMGTVVVIPENSDAMYAAYRRGPSCKSTIGTGTDRSPNSFVNLGVNINMHVNKNLLCAKSVQFSSKLPPPRRLSEDRL